jgi:type IV secretory pathway VirB6-like protein
MQKGRLQKIVGCVLILISVFSVFSPLLAIAADPPPATPTLDEQINDRARDTPGCSGWTSAVSNLGECTLLPFTQKILIGFVSLEAWGLGFIASGFEYILNYTVVDMRKNITGLDTINSGWALFRDLANLCFIFILVYIAVVTILGLENFDTKRVLRNVVIIALLVNFSLFFTKFLIDISNVFSVSFYKLTVGNQKDLGVRIMSSFNLQQLFGPESFGKLLGNGGGDIVTNIIIMFTFVAGASFFIVTTAFTFLYVAVLLLIRYLALLLVLILSPLAFLMFVLPSTKIYFDKWKNLLIGQLIFAPLYLMITYLVIVWFIPSILNPSDLNQKFNVSDVFTKIVGEATSTASTSGGAASTGSAFSLIGSVIFGFVASIGMMLAAAVVATKAAMGSGGLVGAAVNKVSKVINPTSALRRTGQLAASGAVLAGTGVKKTAQFTGGTALRATAATGGYLGRQAGALAEKRLKQSQDGINALKIGPSRFNAWAARTGEKILKRTAEGSYDLRNTKMAGAMAGSLGLKNVGKGEERGYRKIIEDRKKAKAEANIKLIESGGAPTVATRAADNANKKAVSKAESTLNAARVSMTEYEQKLAAARDAKNDADIQLYTQTLQDKREAVRKAEFDMNEASDKAKVSARKVVKETDASRLVAAKQKLDYVSGNDKNTFGSGAAGAVNKFRPGYVDGAQKAVDHFTKASKIGADSDIKDITERIDELHAGTKDSDPSSAAYAQQELTSFMQDVVGSEETLQKLPASTFVGRVWNPNLNGQGKGGEDLQVNKAVLDTLEKPHFELLLKNKKLSQKHKKLINEYYQEHHGDRPAANGGGAAGGVDAAVLSTGSTGGGDAQSAANAPTTQNNQQQAAGRSAVTPVNAVKTRATNATTGPTGIVLSPRSITPTGTTQQKTEPRETVIGEDAGTVEPEIDTVDAEVIEKQGIVVNRQNTPITPQINIGTNTQAGLPNQTANRQGLPDYTQRNNPNNL